MPAGCPACLPEAHASWVLPVLGGLWAVVMVLFGALGARSWSQRRRARRAARPNSVAAIQHRLLQDMPPPPPARRPARPRRVEVIPRQPHSGTAPLDFLKDPDDDNSQL
ncbi:MAG: hypothetical protein ACRDQG_01955 [Pseudonocardiaceae bacterium]